MMAETMSAEIAYVCLSGTFIGYAEVYFVWCFCAQEIIL